MIFLNSLTENVGTLPDSTMTLLSCLMLFFVCALQYAGRPLAQKAIRDGLFDGLTAGGVPCALKTGLKTGLTANEKNFNQCSPERGSTRGHGRWSATLRSGRGSPFPGTEKIQRLQG